MYYIIDNPYDTPGWQDTPLRLIRHCTRRSLRQTKYDIPYIYDLTIDTPSMILRPYLHRYTPYGNLNWANTNWHCDCLRVYRLARTQKSVAFFRSLGWTGHSFLLYELRFHFIYLLYLVFRYARFSPS